MGHIPRDPVARGVLGPGQSCSIHVSFSPARADLLRRLGRSAESRVAHDRAIKLAYNTAEIAFLTRRRDQLP